MALPPVKLYKTVITNWHDTRLDGIVLDAETVHRVSLATLQNEFARIVRVQDILDTFIGSAHLTDFQG